MKYSVDMDLWTARLRAVQADASRCPSCDGARWYRNKYRWLQRVADRYGVDFTNLVAAYANYSANASVDANDTYIVDHLNGDKPGTFGDPIRRAHMAMRGEIDESMVFVNAAKVVSFNENIRHPWTDGPITIDRHAADILTNDRPTSTGILAWAHLRGYRALEMAYRIVADELGVRGHELQAEVWVHWTECMSRDERTGVAA